MGVSIDVHQRAVWPALRRLTGILFLILVYSAVAATTLDRFMTRNGSLSHKMGLSFDRYLAQDVPKPFAYRVLMPLIVEAATPVILARLSEGQREKLVMTSPLRRYMAVAAGVPLPLDVSLRYHLGYVMAFTALIGLAFALRALSLAAAPQARDFANLAPVAFVLLLPLTFLHGGYLYDFPELMFLTLAFWAMVRGHLIALLCVMPLAILNKESNILIAVFFAAYAWRRFGDRAMTARVAAVTAMAFVSFGIGRLIASDASGVSLMDNLDKNLSFLTTPQSWFLWFAPYDGLIGFPRGYNLLLTGLLLLFLITGWHHWSLGTRRVLLVAFALNAYLVTAHGYRDETRNWSLVFIPLFLAAIEYRAALSRGNVQPAARSG